MLLDSSSADPVSPWLLPPITFFQDSNPNPYSISPRLLDRLSSAPFSTALVETRLTFTRSRIMTITDQGDSDLLNIAETTA
jgi:hypothetical protein